MRNSKTHFVQSQKIRGWVMGRLRQLRPSQFWEVTLCYLIFGQALEQEKSISVTMVFKAKEV
jgi:hypothetical protein